MISQLRSGRKPWALRAGRMLGLALCAALLAPRLVCAQSAAGKVGPSAVSYRQVTDETGRQVRIPQPARRIVSLAPSLTETLYALGAEARLVGVTDYCDYPPETQTKPKVGGAINPNLEQVVALKPDLVLLTKALNRRETLEALERLSIPVYATDPRTVEGTLDSIAQLAEVIGAGEQGQALVADLRARLAELERLRRGRAPRRVLFVVWQEPLVSIGRQTFLADALRWAGAESVVDTMQDWPRLNLEEVVRLEPEFLVFASSHSEAVKQNLADLRGRPGWRDLDAVREGHVAVISDAVIRPAPRLIDAIKQLARQLHPDAFREEPQTPKEETPNPQTESETGVSGASRPDRVGRSRLTLPGRKGQVACAR